MSWLLRYLVLWMGVLLLTACQTIVAGGQASPESEKTRPRTNYLALDVPAAWGGEVRCTETHGCRLIAVEHETSKIVLHQIEADRTSRLLDKKPLAYHPDSAAWLADDLAVAAVEATHSLDIYRVEGESLRLVEQIKIGMPPRDVVVLSAEQGHYRLLATPYSGTEIVWVDYSPGQASTRITRSTWCEAPWHPVRVSRAPKVPSGGVAVACLDEQRVLFAPVGDLFGTPKELLKIPGEERIVSRHARPSPSGRWLYVALELGERNLRIDMGTGAFQWIAAPVPGAVSVLPIEDDWVIWGYDIFLYLQKLNAQGQVLETRWLDTGGFPTGLQWQDVDGDGEPDLIVYNSSDLPKKKAGVEIIYGPVWEQAQIR